MARSTVVMKALLPISSIRPERSWRLLAAEHSAYLLPADRRAFFAPRFIKPVWASYNVQRGWKQHTEATCLDPIAGNGKVTIGTI